MNHPAAAAQMDFYLKNSVISADCDRANETIKTAVNTLPSQSQPKCYNLQHLLKDDWYIMTTCDLGDPSKFNLSSKTTTAEFTTAW